MGKGKGNRLAGMSVTIEARDDGSEQRLHRYAGTISDTGVDEQKVLRIETARCRSNRGGDGQEVVRLAMEWGVRSGDVGSATEISDEARGPERGRGAEPRFSQLSPEEQEREATELMGRVKARLAEIKLIEAQAVSQEDEENQGTGAAENAVRTA